MALDQSALLEVLDALRNADAADRIKQAAETIYQVLIDAELSAVIGGLARTNGPRHGRTSALVLGHARSQLRPGIWSCASRNCAPGRSSGIVGTAALCRSVPVRGGDGGVSARYVNS